MSEFIVSTRYASSFFELAKEQNSLTKVAEDMELIVSVLKSSRDLRNVLASPIIKADKKETILIELFNNKVSNITLNFIKFVINKKRENILLDIASRFIELNNERQGFLNVGVKSAQTLSDEQKTNIESKLEEVTQKKISANYSVDDSLIGGFVVKVGDTVMNASVKHQLELLQKQFLSGTVKN